MTTDSKAGDPMRFTYQAEKMVLARRCLMLPHTLGVAQSIVDAFDNCDAAFHRFDLEQLDEVARPWADTILRLMDHSEYADPQRIGLWMVKAKLLTVDEQRELSNAVDGLAWWFVDRCDEQ